MDQEQIIIYVGIAIFSVFFILLPLAIRQANELLNKNFKLTSEILISELKHSLSGYSTQGFYKGRKITLQFTWLAQSGIIYVEPRKAIKVKPYYFIAPAVTENTRIDTKGRIWYTRISGLDSKAKYFQFFLRQELTRKDITFFLDELTRAAEIAESWGKVTQIA